MNFEIGIKIYSQSKANSQASMKSQLSTVLYTHTVITAGMIKMAILLVIRLGIHSQRLT